MTVRGVTLAAAVVLLDISLAFQNVWPTPMIRWHGEFSLECGVLLILISAAQLWLGPLSRRVGNWLSAIWVALVLGHYADVTTPALYGRDINLYWDVRYMPDVAAMVARAAPWWLLAAGGAAVAAVLALLFVVFRWALRRVAAAAFDAQERAPIVIAGLMIVALFTAQQAGLHVDNEPVFATPVTATYARQVRLVAGALNASKTLPPGPPMTANLAAVAGADVYLVFIESYGAIAYERRDMAPALAAARTPLAAAIHETGRDVVSAFVESPTFGGSSWLAHLSLMSGVEVRDPETNARLMTEPRETMVTAFKRAGHRAVALMPGLRQAWPEGAFYGFDDIYGASRLDYRGPEFGWFAVPDQFTLAKFDALERRGAGGAPRFVFFPTISTHFPFIPTPPYQPDWTRIFDAHPYDGPAIVRAYAQQPDWTHFGPGYVQAIAYDYATLAGYLRRSADRDVVMILLGDHQPAAAVSGEGAPWDVPVHVIASRPRILDALKRRGFRDGLIPTRPSLGKMHTLLPTLLDAFSTRPGETAAGSLSTENTTTLAK
jgi:hypothetical protein